MDATLDIKLDPPRELDGRPIDTLHLREPKAGELVLAEHERAKSMSLQAERKAGIVLLALVTKTTQDFVRALPAGVFRDAHAFFRTIRKDGPLVDAWAKDRPAVLDITLDVPISIKVDRSGEVDVLSLRELSCGAAEDVEGELNIGWNPESVLRYQIAMVAKGAGLTTGMVHQLPIRKLDEAARFLEGFMRAGPDTEAGLPTGEI